MNNFYAKDEKNIFAKIDCCSVKKMEKFDLETFMILYDGFAKDKNNCYKNGDMIVMNECDKIREQ